MKRSPFALVSLIAGILLAVPAVLIAVIDLLRLPEAHPLVVIAFPVVALFSLPEAPAQMLPSSPGIPVILPVIALACGILSMLKREVARKTAIAGIALALSSVAVYLTMRWISV